MNEFAAALELAVAALSKKDLFTAEIQALLERQGVSTDVTVQVLEHLNRKGILNDRRAAEAILTRYGGKRAAGVEKLRMLLAERGAPAELVEEVLCTREMGERLEVQRLLELKYPNGASLAQAGRFLASRGFSEDAIETALEEWPGTVPASDESKV